MFSVEGKPAVQLDTIHLYKNFPKEQFLRGELTNHELRACLSEELLTFIKEQPEFRLVYNSKELDKEALLNEETTVLYRIPNEYDLFE